jgi:hypothetical protein
MFTWVYELSTQAFLYGGPCDAAHDPITQGVVKLSRHPKPRLERYDGAGSIRPATAQEITDYDAAQKDEQTTRQFDSEKLTKAVAIWTAQQFNIPLAQARQEILAIYRGLL